jgi:hypothetical protein
MLCPESYMLWEDRTYHGRRSLWGILKCQNELTPPSLSNSLYGAAWMDSNTLYTLLMPTAISMHRNPGSRSRMPAPSESSLQIPPSRTRRRIINEVPTQEDFVRYRSSEFSIQKTTYAQVVNKMPIDPIALDDPMMLVPQAHTRHRRMPEFRNECRRQSGGD